jgi:hypothetical protein
MNDKPPNDFDPSSLIDDPDPMEEPRQRHNKSDYRNSAQDDVPASVEDLLPMLHVIPPRLKRLLLTGSCCTGVAVLYLVAAWDHGWIPGIKGVFASTDQVEKLEARQTRSEKMLEQSLELDIAQAIRDLYAENCPESRAVTEQLESLQSRYRAITGQRYPHRECKKATLDEGTKG